MARKRKFIWALAEFILNGGFHRFSLNTRLTTGDMLEMDREKSHTVKQPQEAIVCNYCIKFTNSTRRIVVYLGEDFKVHTFIV